MNKLMLLGGVALLALSGPASAQTAGAEPAPEAPASAAPSDQDTTPDTSTASDMAGTPAADAAPANAAPADDVAQTTAPAADAAATMPASPAPATASADAAAKVNADWAKYDEGNKGKLTPLEFGNWVMAAKGQDMTAQVERTKTSKRANLPAIKVLNETAGDFAKADTDHDRMISPDELAVYLSA
jgi:hypothetical protein